MFVNRAHHNAGRDPAWGGTWLVVSLAVAIAGAAIGWRSTAGIDILWDEEVDLTIARGLAADPLFGAAPTLDPSQMRLPMYVNAAAFFVSGREDLALARAISLVFGAITVLAAASLARMLMGPSVAMLAAALLAFSPYFLSYARIAMTEGDVFFACFVTLAVWGFVRYLKRPTPSRWALAAVLLAMAVGAKFFAAFLLIVFATLASSTHAPVDVGRAPRRADTQRLRRLLAAQVIVVVVTALLAMLHARLPSAAAGHVKTLAAGGWLVLSGLWLYTLLFVLSRGGLPAGRMARFVALVVFAASTLFALMPVHLLDHAIGREIVARTLRWDGRFPLALWSDHLRLYAGIVLIKLTLPLGVISAGALVYAAFRERVDGRWRPCILPVVFLVVLLCLLPLRQSFYLMGVYPLIIIVTAAAIVGVGRACRRGRQRWAWGLLVLAACGHLGFETWRSHPNYTSFGWRAVGESWLGAESRGYRNLIQTPSDGVESLIRWCLTDPGVRPGDHVVSFLWEERIIERLLPTDLDFEFVPRGVGPASDSLPPQPALDEADFVLLHINNVLGYGDRPPDRPPAAVLAGAFKIVHTVRRGPLEVAWVYARR
jgi:4-amino-4-deoxy-L-arabinose transferase-like glycosyltransferase